MRPRRRGGEQRSSNSGINGDPNACDRPWCNTRAVVLSDMQPRSMSLLGDSLVLDGQENGRYCEGWLGCPPRDGKSRAMQYDVLPGLSAMGRCSRRNRAFPNSISKRLRLVSLGRQSGTRTGRSISMQWAGTRMVIPKSAFDGALLCRSRLKV